MSKKDCFFQIKESLANSTPEQLGTLFDLYITLDCHNDYFMPESSHMDMIDSYYETACIRSPLTFKTFICNAIPQYTSESKYPALLEAIQMIHNNHPINQIIASLLAWNN